ncbi:STAS domain-containing protein, partial [Haliangium sp. UPWRP_2]|uniref:STAS domain-containing protein n=1 Tax=Haliangium sp. UPWRP_2 TaxID=1931276 RepID=UPI0011B246C7
YRYLAFNQAHKQTIKAIWNVDIAIGMDMLAKVVGRQDDRIKAQASFDRVLAGEQFITIDEYGDDKLSRRTYENAWYPLRGDNQEVTGLVCFLSDVTERERLRSDLGQQNEQLEKGMQENAKLVDQLRSAISELSTPVIELWESVLALPIVGRVDTERSNQMSERLLEAVQQYRARFVIIDLTGVNLIDTHTAGHFIRLARAVGLLGSECVIAGIQATMAQTLIGLGVDLGMYKTTRSLKQALEYCIAKQQPEQRAKR